MLMRFALLAPLVALTACATVQGRAGPVALDQAQRVGRLLVTPIKLEEDSRCPMNARCVWAGRVVVRGAIDDGRTRLERTLTLGEPAEPGVVLDGVTPDRVGGAPPLLSGDYRFHFSAVKPD